MTSKDIVSGQAVRTSGQRLPGVRYRTETRTRLVPHTVNGETELVEEDYDVQVPVPPRDWDLIVLHAVTAAAMGLIVVAVVWSVASIGDLLGRAITAPIAYLGATAFVTAWIVCMALEWLARYNIDRARGPRTAGTAALLLDMAAVCVHGALEDSLYVGIAGACVSALAKGMWTVVMSHQARPLPELTRRWLAKREGDAAARMAIGAQLRALARVEGQAAVYAPLPAAVDTRPDTTPDTDSLSGRHVRTVHAAVRAAAHALPVASPQDIVDHLAAAGITTTEETVRAVLGTHKDSTDTTDSRPQPRVRPIAPRGQSVADSVRTALASGITDPSAVLSYVRGLHGQGVSADTVARTRRREDPSHGHRVRHTSH
ncbi:MULTISPECIES: protein transporter Sec31 [unclassified Streptomyces]|uniref:protein transporter Sec31 n=1 Tax=unclassified Streptomyces TaxID=2593676 RepID=UPI0037FB9103